MPKGQIAGFNRPLAESELIFKTAFRIKDKYGRDLENDQYRAEQEERILQIVEGFVPGQHNLDIELSPAGGLTGIHVALGADELVSHPDASRASLGEMEDAMGEIVSEVDEINGFAVPNAYSRGFAEPVDEVYYSIEAE